MLLTEGKTSDYKGVAVMRDALPRATELIADRGLDAAWFRNALAERSTAACIPSQFNRKVVIPRDATPYRHRHKIDIMFCHLKDWCCIRTRYTSQLPSPSGSDHRVLSCDAARSYPREQKFCRSFALSLHNVASCLGQNP